MFRVLLLFLLFSSLAQGEELRSGRLKYKISGTCENGEETFCFDGKKTYLHRITTFTPGGNEISVTVDSLQINDGTYIYVIDMLQKEGYKYQLPSGFPAEKMFSVLTKSSGSYSLPQLSSSPFQEIHEKTKVSKNEVTFFGKPCEIIKGPFFQTYFWKNLILRQEITKPVKILKEVVEMKLNTDIPDSMFSPPEDVSLTDFNLSAFADAIESLKKINASKSVQPEKKE